MAGASKGSTTLLTATLHRTASREAAYVIACCVWPHKISGKCPTTWRTFNMSKRCLLANNDYRKPTKGTACPDVWYLVELRFLSCCFNIINLD
ncbi:hypothetical protein RB195_000216 [Necator americanus]|uniref:PAN domain protein n=1 Tax=Necator americanus TaxID=51031 RepID=A0ABR1D9E2_NECAM